MIKKFFSFFGGNGRVLLMRLLARLHCAVIAACLFAAVFEYLGSVNLAEASGVARVYLRGLLFGIPAALSYYAVEKLPALWQFLAVSVLISGFSWLLTGHPLGAAAAAVVCFFRLYGRLSEEKSRSLLDTPGVFGFVPFLVLFCLSAVYGMASTERLSVLSAVLYLLILLAFRGIERIDEYLDLNRNMGGVPVRRIQVIAGAAVAALVLVGAFLLIPPALGLSGEFRVVLPEHRTYTPSPMPSAEIAAPGGEMPGLEKLFGGEMEPVFQIPVFVSYLFYILATGALAALLIYGAYRLFKNFRTSYSDGRDVIEDLPEDAGEKGGLLPEAVKRPFVLDFSPNAVIRRSYRKAVLKAAKELPECWKTPAEIETGAAMEAQCLHDLYEKARYGPVLCTREDLRKLKETAQSRKSGTQR